MRKFLNLKEEKMNSSNQNRFPDGPLKRSAEKSKEEELSPMSPPDPYSPQTLEKIPFENMHPFLKKLINEHSQLSMVLNEFENALIAWRTNNWIFNKEIDERLRNFFEFYDEHIVEHHNKEEKILFPILNERLMESGEHSKGEKLSTAIDLMEDEHIKIAQAVALVFNFLGLGSRLSDPKSKEITFESAFDQGIAVVETLRLHIHREDNILFLQAMHLFSEADFDKLI
ncbi:MAG: hypothetical protein CVV24_02490 [Ignavibacteriae bacterium HGW-Ignavibacteriae-3]|nr:MAG: hypothetical protein CVV24_02490 [Ignavibacteriae bacterium HGW-Ignavibacteriae-3]